MAEYDLIIIGGGINGCGVARDAALRGLRVLLLEKGDLGSGTSGGSSKLIHGGLRYLPQGHFGLVREALREQGLLLNQAPHLVEPMKFVFPLQTRGPGPHPWVLRLGLRLYSGLGSSAPQGEGRHGWWNAAQTVQEEPNLNPVALRGAGWYWDAATDDARLCLENALDAETHGARILTWTEALSAVEGPSAVSVRYRDRVTGVEDGASAPCLFCGLGPYPAASLDGLLPPVGFNLALSRGSHLLLRGDLVKNAVVLSSPDGRIAFLIPWGGWTLLGTTDVLHQGDPGAAHISSQESEYLLNLAQSYLGSQFDLRSRITGSFAAVRPLVGGRAKDLHRVSREHRLIRRGPVIFLAGGKLTTYRSISEEITDQVFKVLGRRAPLSPTRTQALPRGQEGRAESVVRGLSAKSLPLAKDEILGLARVYGSALRQLLRILDQDPDLARPLWDGPRPLARSRVLRGEAVFAARHDKVRRLEDFMIRRTRLALTEGGAEKECLQAARILETELGWTKRRTTEEVDNYLKVRDERLGVPTHD